MTTIDVNMNDALMPGAAGAARAAAAAGAEADARRFDGVICFGGEDWWYHNRGHFDMQMMRQLAGRVPVLYVNSIGMRVPSPAQGRMFFSRIGRKMRSMRRGLVRVSDRFSVLSPFVSPGRAGLALTGPLLTRAVRAAAERQGITRPLVWIACPTAAPTVNALAPAAVVYQRTDRYECFDGVDADRIREFDGWLKARADLTVFCSSHLHRVERAECKASCLVDHGVDLAAFAAPVDDADAPEPAELRPLARPRVGFVGGIDAHTFDHELFTAVARAMPDVSFVLVGACSLPAPVQQTWTDMPNVTALGKRAYADVPGYMGACDVLIMPWTRSRWIDACNPVKLKEYLATGRPVVSTDFPELRHYAGLVTVANDAPSFADAIRAAIAAPGDAGPRRERVRAHGWPTKIDLVLRALAGRGTEPLTPDPAAAVQEARPALRFVAAPAADERMTRIDVAAAVVLAGGLRPSPLVGATGRSVLDLWLTPGQTVLGAWVERCAEATPPMPRDLPIRIVHDAILPAPWPNDSVRVEQEARPFRGPAGVVRDACVGYAPDRHVLVVEAARYASTSLVAMLAAHVEASADITIATNPDGAPAGIYLIRCGALELVAPAGFQDMKEQWLRRATAEGLCVRDHRLPGSGALPLRTRPQFIAAARIAGHAARSARRSEPWHVVCPQATVHAGATVVDSIVMPGTVVGDDAVVARSIVCPGAVVPPGANIVDSVVRAGAHAIGSDTSPDNGKGRLP